MTTTSTAVSVEAERNAKLDADLLLPDVANSIVLFVHGSGSGRASPRNRHVADVLYDRGIASLLVDLLTPHEQRVDQDTFHLRFDIPLLARRVIGAIDWLTEQPRTRGLHIGLYGASTGASGALVAAADRPDEVRAVVSRGGRPDLAGDRLPQIRCPVLLIVGSQDPDVLRINRLAEETLRCPVILTVIPGASHLFEEPGTLEQAGKAAAEWYEKYLLGMED